MLYRWRNKSWRYRGIAAGLKAGKSMDELIEEFKVSGHTILVIADAERRAAQKETKKGIFTGDNRENREPKQ